MNDRIVLSCEHGGNRVPASYRHLFHDAAQALASHRGWDAGALPLARAFRRRLDAPLFYSTVSRLVVELNRSIGHRKLFSEYTRRLDEQRKLRLLDRHYHPYRRQIESWIDDQLRGRARVVHLSLHTFTPIWNGQDRNVDVGFLYDPARKQEAALCQHWGELLKQRVPDLRIRRNFPYRGCTDGLTTHLRRQMGRSYLGIELEVNQRWPAAGSLYWRQLQEHLYESFASACRRQEPKDQA